MMLNVPGGGGTLVSILSPADELRHGIWPVSRTVWMAALYIVLFVIRPWEELFPWLAVIRFERLYAVVMVLAILFGGSGHVKVTRQVMAVAGFFAALTVSTVFAFDTALAFDKLLEYLNILVFYWVLLVVGDTLYRLMFLAASYVTAMGLYLAKAQWEFFVHGQHRYDMGVVRLVGIENTFGGPNNLAMSIAASMPFALLLWKNREVITQTWPAAWRKYFARSLLVYGYLSISSIVLTNSRSGMLGVAVLTMVLALSGKGFERKILYCVVGVFALSLVWMVMPEENKGRLRTVWAPESGPENAKVSAEGREAGLKAGWQMFRHYPVTGVGPDNFVRFRVQNLDGEPLQAHNLVGQLLGENGALGALAFLIMVGVTLANCSRIRRLSQGRDDAVHRVAIDMSAACRRSVAMLFFLGLFGHNLYRFNWLWLAVFADATLQHLVNATESADAPWLCPSRQEPTR